MPAYCVRDDPSGSARTPLDIGVQPEQTGSRGQARHWLIAADHYRARRDDIMARDENQMP